MGALCVFEGRIVGVGSNTRERDQNPVGHAEIGALKMAAQTLGTWRLRRDPVCHARALRDVRRRLGAQPTE